MYKINFYIVLIISFLFIGCAPKKVMVREHIIELPIPTLKVEVDSVKPINIDPLLKIAIEKFATDTSFFQGEKFTDRGDTVTVSFFLKDKQTQKPKFKIEVQQAPLLYKDVDTIHAIKESEPSSNNYFIWAIVIIVVIFFLIILILKRR